MWNNPAQLLATVSHEIRTPLSGIVGIAELLLDGTLTQEQRDHLETIRGSGQLLLRLVDDLLHLGEQEAGALTLEIAPFEPRLVLMGVLQLLAPRARGKGVALMGLADASVPVALRGDALRLRQMLINLASNAIKFTDSGEIFIEMSAHRAPQGSRAMLRVEVRDTGIGLTPGQIQGLFMPFAQAHGKARGGSGLGLAICRHLAECMGGEVGVCSTEGVGSTFWFTACLEIQDPPPDVPDVKIPLVPRRPAGPLPYRVLVVDDDPISRRVACRLLVRLGLDVACVANGREALAALQHGHHDLVLMDRHMPEMDGLSASRAIRDAERPGGARVPVIALSASGSDREQEGDDCRGAGMDGYLTKPLSADQLRQELARWLPALEEPG